MCELLNKMEILVALMCLDAVAVAGADEHGIWHHEFNASCRALKLLFPEQHPFDETIDVEWSDKVLSKAEPKLVQLVRAH